MVPMTPRRLASMAALVLPAFLYGLYRFSVGVLVPSMESAYSMSDAAAGGVVSASVAMVGIGVIGSGYLGQRYGDLKVILAGFLVFSVSMAMVALTSSLIPFSSLFLLAALGSGLMITPSYGVAASLYPNRKGFAASFVTSFYSFAGFVGPTTTGYLLAEYGWHAPFVEFAAVGLAFCAFFFGALGAGTRASSSGALGAFAQLLRTRVVLELSVAAFFADFGFLVYLSWAPKFLISSFGGSGGATTIDSVFGIGLGLGGLGTLAGGALFDRIGGRRSATLASALPAGAMLGVYLANSFATAVVFVLLTGILANMFWSLITAMCQVNVSKERMTAATSVVQTSGFVGAFLGPGITGAAGGPVSHVLILTSVVPYIVLMAVVLIAYRDPKTAEPPRT
jgi:MFS family permease